MLTYQDTFKGPSQARLVGPPRKAHSAQDLGRGPQSSPLGERRLRRKAGTSARQARSAHADTPGQLKGIHAGEARRPARRGPQFNPSEVSSCWRTWTV